MKIIVYAILLIIFSIGIKLAPDFPALMFIFGSSWCISGFLLIKKIIETKINKKQ